MEPTTATLSGIVDKTAPAKIIYLEANIHQNVAIPSVCLGEKGNPFLLYI